MSGSSSIVRFRMSFDDAGPMLAAFRTVAQGGGEAEAAFKTVMASSGQAAQALTAFDQGLRSLPTQTRAASQGLQSLRQNIQNAGYQFNDLFVQIQGGGNVITAITQQGSQLLGMFGPAGSIASVGLALAGIAANALIGKSGTDALVESAKDLDASYSDLTKRAQDYAKGADDQAKSVQQLATYFDSLSEAQRRQATSQLLSQRSQIQQSIQTNSETAGGGFLGARSQLSALSVVAEAAGDTTWAEQLSQALDLVSTKTDGSTEALANLYNRVKALADQVGGLTADALNKYADQVAEQITKSREWEDRLGNNAAAIAAVTGAVQDAATAMTALQLATGNAVQGISAVADSFGQKTQQILDRVKQLQAGGVGALNSLKNEFSDQDKTASISKQLSSDYTTRAKAAGQTPDQISASLSGSVGADIQAQAAAQVAAERQLSDLESNYTKQQQAQAAAARKSASDAAKAAREREAADKKAMADALKLSNQQAEQQAKDQAALDQQKEQLDYVNTEISLLGTDQNQRTIILATMKAQAEAQKKIADPDIRAQYVAQATAIAEGTVQLKQQQAAINEVGNFMDRTFDTVGNSIVEAFAQGKDAAVSFGSVGKAVVVALTEEILKLSLINPFKNWLTGSNDTTMSGIGGILGKLGGAIGSLFGGGSATTNATTISSFGSGDLAHTGGVAGSLALSRQVNPAIFSGARRYHTGGLVGDEVPAILRKGEVVLTQGDATNVSRALNAGSSGSSSVTNHNVSMNIDARGATQDTIQSLYQQMPAIALSAVRAATRRGGSARKDIRGGMR